MSDAPTRSALVTGATSGLGFEAAAQLAEQDFATVTITARTAEKAEAARTRLVVRTGKHVFETLIMDNDHLDSVDAAAATLAERDKQIDVMILNAGVAPPSDLFITADGFEGTVAATLLGHHLLTMRLLDSGMLAEQARIVISGSEAARGDVPTFHPLDIDSFAAENFDGNLEAAIESQLLMEPPAQYKPSNVYATAKLFVAWWATALAERLPEGTTVNAVSPGSTPDTNAIKNAPFYMRHLMVPLFKVIPGMSHSVADGAGRYIEATSYADNVTGKFFASRPKKMTGPLVEIEMDHLDNPAGQQALWNVTNRVARGAARPTA